MKKNKFYKIRTIFDIAFIVIIVLFALGCFPISGLSRSQITAYFISFGAFVLFGLVFVATEIYAFKSLNKKYYDFILAKKYNDGVEYLKKFTKCPLFCNVTDLCCAFIGSFFVYLDDLQKAKPLFESVDLTGKNSHPLPFSFCLMYLYVLSLDENDNDYANTILKLYDDKSNWLTESEKKYKQISDNIAVIEAFRNNEKSKINEIAVKYAEIPLFKRLSDVE